MATPADLAGAISIARNVAWLGGWVFRLLMLRRKEPPIFGVEWRLYDSAPTERNSVGSAAFQRTWRRSVRGKWLRLKERTTNADTRRYYGGDGFLRDRKLVLNWAAEDRPDTFGVLFLTVDEDCRQMYGYTVYTPQDTGVTVSLPIWFRR